jgi:hypothetical protein
MTRLIKGHKYRIRWIDAFEHSAWTSESELDQLIKEHTPEEQTLYFIKATKDLYIFTSGKIKEGSDYLDIHAIPKGFIKKK